MTWERGQRVVLRANVEEGWEREEGTIEEINEMPWGTSYIVRLDLEYVSSVLDDRLREVTEEQFG